MNLVERLKLAAVQANEDLHAMSKLRDALVLDVEKKDKIIISQHNTIEELNEENNDLVIEIAKLKNDHDKHVDMILSKGMPELMTEARKYLDEQK